MAADTWHIMIITIWIPCCYLGSGELASKSMWKTGIIAFSGLLHSRVRAPSRLSRDKSLAVQPSAVAALVKTREKKKRKRKSPNTEEEFHATTSEHMRSVFTVTIWFYRLSISQMSRFVFIRATTWNSGSCLQPYPSGGGYSSTRKATFGACGIKSLKLSNASFAVQRNSHLWL